MSQKKHNWLLYAIITMLTWGVWMTFSDPTLGDTYLGISKGFASEMVYVIWALSMIPCALFALFNIRFKLDVRPRSVALSMLASYLLPALDSPSGHGRPARNTFCMADLRHGCGHQLRLYFQPGIVS